MLFTAFLESLNKSFEKGGERYYNLCAIFEALSSNKFQKFRIENSLLLTLLYVDSEKLYELYPYDLNIYLNERDHQSLHMEHEDHSYLNSREYVNEVCAKSAISVGKNYPYVEGELIRSYIEYLFHNKAIKDDIDNVFFKKLGTNMFDISNLYFVVY